MNGADLCLYVTPVKDVNGKKKFVILALYVDDILLTSNITDMMAKQKVSLGKLVNISDHQKERTLLFASQNIWK